MNASKSRPARILWVAAIVAIAALAASVYFNYRVLPFDEVRWKNARANKDDGVLYAMADDLAKQLRHSKMSREEVLRLIGPEDVIWGTFHRYRLGNHRGRFVIISVSWTMDVIYDPDTHRVIEAKVISD